MTFGAGMQQVPAGVFMPALASVCAFSDCWRWMIQTWSRESTETPIVEPSNQWLGRGFGQNGSTSNRGATPSAPNSAAVAEGCAGAAALDAPGGGGGVASTQALSNAPVEAMSRIPARRVMVPPVVSAVLAIRACSSLG